MYEKLYILKYASSRDFAHVVKLLCEKLELLYTVGKLAVLYDPARKVHVRVYVWDSNVAVEVTSLTREGVNMLLKILRPLEPIEVKS